MNKLITWAWLEGHGISDEMRKWIEDNLPAAQPMNWKRAVNFAFNNNHFDYANWLIHKLLPESKRPYYALNAAKLCEHVYNEAYPTDTRVHDCNVMTERYLDGKATIEELNMAWSAVRSVAESAVEYAAYVAWSAACSAVRSSVVKSAALSAVAAYPTIARQVIDYGIKLIEEVGK
jgi:hypothetical protein